METTMKPDFDLLSTLVKWAGQDEANLNEFFEGLGWPEWNQEVWANEVRNGECQTACCIAGNVIVQSDEYVFIWQDYGKDENGKRLFSADYVVPAKWEEDPKDPTKQIKVPAVELAKNKFPWMQPSAISVEKAAMDILRLSPYEKAFLFTGSNSLADVVDVAVTIAEHHGEALDIPDSLMALRGTSRYNTESDYREGYLVDVMYDRA